MEFSDSTDHYTHSDYAPERRIPAHVLAYPTLLDLTKNCLAAEARNAHAVGRKLRPNSQRNIGLAYIETDESPVITAQIGGADSFALSSIQHEADSSGMIRLQIELLKDGTDFVLPGHEALLADSRYKVYALVAGPEFPPHVLPGDLLDECCPMDYAIDKGLATYCEQRTAKAYPEPYSLSEVECASLVAGINGAMEEIEASIWPDPSEYPLT